jgi:hypothetical protein
MRVRTKVFLSKHTHAFVPAYKYKETKQTTLPSIQCTKFGLDSSLPTPKRVTMHECVPHARACHTSLPATPARRPPVPLACRSRLPPFCTSCMCTYACINVHIHVCMECKPSILQSRLRLPLCMHMCICVCVRMYAKIRICMYVIYKQTNTHVMKYLRM